jgi:hypothetical protein
VLDCYAGEGLVWDAVEREIGRPVRRIGIDIHDWGAGFYLPGDNTRYLRTIDLTQFNIVDLDAYGVPYEQLRILIDRGFSGRVYATVIQTIVGEMPHGMLREIGFTDDMISACPTIFGKRGWQFFLEWLALSGVREIRHRSMGRKHYVAFDLDEG